VLVDAVFAEAGLPVPAWRWMAMPIPAWAVLLRCGWYMGWSTDGESRGRVVQRASSAADMLQQLSCRHGTVLHVGHGILLAHIGSQLAARGWRTADRPIAGNWTMRVYNIES
jgi:broad specificity phosphatase PhoE